MAIFGQDVQQVRDLSRQLTTKASDIQGVVSQLTSAVNSVNWQGPDATRFKNDWSNTHVPQLKRVISALQDASQAASRNADEQERASS